MNSTAKQSAATALIVGLIVILLLPEGADYPAHEFRRWLFQTEGFSDFNPYWYGGHSTPGYSLLYPPIAAFIGLKLSGLIAVVACSFIFALLCERWFTQEVARYPSLIFAVGINSNLIVGRMPFLFACITALGCLLALTNQRRYVALALAAISSLISPLTGLFLGLICGGVASGHATNRAWRSSMIWLAAATAAALPILILTALYPSEGVQPFPLTTVVPAVVILTAAFLLTSKQEQALRVTVLIYLLATVVFFLISSPVGSNIVRLGMTVATPLLLAIWLKYSREAAKKERSRSRGLAWALLLVTSVWWQWGPVAQSLKRTWSDPSLKAGYHQPLIDRFQLMGINHETTVEIPFTMNHWEAFYVAKHVSLARGWERQLDRKRNRIFYQERLNEGSYREWLRQRKVKYVAVANAPLDYSAASENRLIKSGPSYLKPIWSSQNWHLYKVID